MEEEWGALEPPIDGVAPYAWDSRGSHGSYPRLQRYYTQ